MTKTKVLLLLHAPGLSGAPKTALDAMERMHTGNITNDREAVDASVLQA